MKLSPFNPIYFNGHDVFDHAMKDFTHVFAPSDHILLEIMHTAGETLPDLRLIGNGLDMSLGWATIDLNGKNCISYYEMKGLEEGKYHFILDDMVSNPILVTEDVENTVLVQYAMRDNTSRRDICTKIKGELRYFDIRFRGGFKDSDWVFSVESDQFTTQASDIVTITAVEATDKTLTVGSPCGVPVWLGDMINRIAASDLLFVDGIRYNLTGDSGVEILWDELSERFVYGVKLRQARFLDLNFERMIRVALRRTPTHFRKSTANNLRAIK